MTMSKNTDLHTTLDRLLDELAFRFMREQYRSLAEEAARKQWDGVEYLCRLVEGEAAARHDRSVRRRIRLARFPVVKTLDDFDWTWPKLNRAQIQQIFRLDFMRAHANVVFLGSVGLGKSHLSIALGYAACLAGYSVRFATAIDIVNNLAAAQAANNLKKELRKYTRPQVLVIDELGYLPIDRLGADLLFQVISQRYERGSIILNSNKPYKHWPEIFHNDSVLATAVLDRLLHHADTVLITGKSYRIKDHQPEA
jgi:DNA replication protein DnaC